MRLRATLSSVFSGERDSAFLYECPVRDGGSGPEYCENMKGFGQRLDEESIPGTSAYYTFDSIRGSGMNHKNATNT
jgi:hypothetical protein